MSGVRLFGSLACAALLSSCASFSDLPPRTTHSPTVVAAPLDVHLTTAQKSYLQVGREWIDFPSNGMADVAADAIRAADGVRVTDGSESAPTLELELSEYQSEGPGLLVILTAFVIPGPVDHHIALKLTLSDSPDAKSTCTRSYDERTWYQTFLVFVYPFRSPAYKRMKATEVLALDCLAELLERRSAPPATALPNTGTRMRIE